MSKCSKCNAETKGSAKFCKACGSNLSGSDASLNDKKARVMKQERRWVKPAAIIGVVLLLLAGAWTAKGVVTAKKMGNGPAFSSLQDASARLSQAAAVKNEGGDVRIPLQTIDDGKAHFFAYASGGKTITFFVMKAADGSIRTALDACVACNHAKLGYRQESDHVVGNNCGMGFKPTDIGVETGGCSPIAVPNKSINGKMIVLKAKDLEAGAQYF
jgi:Membrane iron-sulfur containing protein FtrD-like